MTKFYVYFLRRPDYPDPMDNNLSCPFYIGKGINGRHREHRREAAALLHKSGRKTHKVNIIHKLWNQGLDFEEDIIAQNLSEQEAFELEIEAISLYGRIDNGNGCLTNLTNGGDGAAGCFQSPEKRKKLSIANSGPNHRNYGKSLPDKTKEKIRKANKGRPVTKEAKEKMSLAKKGKPNHPQTPESRKKISQARKGIVFTEEHRQNLSNAQNQRFANSPSPFKGKRHTKEANEKNRQAHLGKILTPEHKQKCGRKGDSHHMYGKHHTEEVKQKNKR